MPIIVNFSVNSATTARPVFSQSVKNIEGHRCALFPTGFTLQFQPISDLPFYSIYTRIYYVHQWSSVYFPAPGYKRLQLSSIILVDIRQSYRFFNDIISSETEKLIIGLLALFKHLNACAHTHTHTNTSYRKAYKRTLKD